MCVNFYIFVTPDSKEEEKSRIQETLTLSKCVNNSIVKQTFGSDLGHLPVFLGSMQG